MIGKILLLYLQDKAFETRFDNLEASNSCNLKGMVLSVPDYILTDLKELEASMEMHWEPECITPLN